MRIHTDVLDECAIAQCIRRSGAEIKELSEHGSRTHRHAFEVQLYGESRHRTQDGSGFGASWDQWGIFFAAVYDHDGGVRVGGTKSPVYRDAEDFHHMTCNRFHTLTPGDTHRNHKWNPAGDGTFTCELRNGTGCGARMRNRYAEQRFTLAPPVPAFTRPEPSLRDIAPERGGSTVYNGAYGRDVEPTQPNGQSVAVMRKGEPSGFSWLDGS